MNFVLLQHGRSRRNADGGWELHTEHVSHGQLGRWSQSGTYLRFKDDLVLFHLFSVFVKPTVHFLTNKS